MSGVSFIWRCFLHVLIRDDRWRCIRLILCARVHKMARHGAQSRSTLLSELFNDSRRRVVTRPAFIPILLLSIKLVRFTGVWNFFHFFQRNRMVLFWIALCLLVHSIVCASVSVSTSPTCSQKGSHEGEPLYGCTDSIDWMGDGYSNEDCRAVIQKLFFLEVTKHGDSEFEFLLPGAKNRTDKPVIQTPRRYTVG